MLMASERRLSQSSYRGVVARFFGERRGGSHYTVKPCKLPQPNVTVPCRRVGGWAAGWRAPRGWSSPEMGTQPNTPRDAGYEFVYSGCRINVVLGLETRRQRGSAKIKERLLGWWAQRQRRGGGRENNCLQEVTKDN